jgi:hypothetical protein
MVGAGQEVRLVVGKSDDVHVHSIQPMRIRTLDELQTEPNATPKSSLTWYSGTEFMLVV